jgi:DNA-binding CsgD family transcriptional regulator
MDIEMTRFPAPEASPAHRPFIGYEGGNLKPSPVIVGGYFGGIFLVHNSPLSPTQTRVLALRAIGLTSEDVSRVLEISEHTVATQTKRLRRHLGATSIMGAMATAFSGNESFFRTLSVGKFEGTLTLAEKDILTRLSFGESIPEIAGERGSTQQTARTQIRDMQRKSLPGVYLPSLVSMAHLTDAVFDQPPGPMHLSAFIETDPLLPEAA